MPSMIGMGLPRVSELVVDADLTIPATYKLITNRIDPNAASNLSIYNSAGELTARTSLTSPFLVAPSGVYTEKIGGFTPPNPITVLDPIKVDEIRPSTLPYTTITGNIELAATKYLKAPLARIDALYDQTGASATSFPAGLNTDDIHEYTAAHGIVFDDTVTIDSLITLLTQRYRTAAAGATSRYASAAEVFISNPGATPTQIKSSVTVPDWYAGATNTFTIKFDGHSSAVSAGDEMYLTVNDVEVGTRLPLSSPGYSTKNQDIGTLKAGDVIKIMCVDTVGTGGNLYCRNFEILSTDTVNLPISTETW